ncbi:hypothetical protein ACS0TY_029512 [Phlomoides rotata]
MTTNSSSSEIIQMPQIHHHQKSFRCPDILHHQKSFRIKHDVSSLLRRRFERHSLHVGNPSRYA